MANCIYCNSDANTLEHVIPAAFGEFRGAPALKDRLCKDCNNQRLGLLDQQVARCGPEGFMRAFYGVRGRSSHAPVNPFVRGSAGGGRLVFATFDREVGVEANLEILDGVVRQMCELVLVETAGKAHHFPLTEATTADQLRAAIKRRAIPEPYEARLSCYPHERIWIKKLLQEHSPEVTFSQPKLMSQVIETPEVHFQNGERYFRGLAKIGLHYFLTQFPVYSGHEQVFSRIRSFIYEDTKEPIRRVNEFVHYRHHPLLQAMLNTDARPASGWRAHVLSAEMRPGACLAHIQMFLTEHNPKHIYTINLVQDPAITEYAAHAHLYRYYADGMQGQVSGDARSLETIRVARTFPPSTPVVTVTESPG